MTEENEMMLRGNLLHAELWYFAEKLKIFTCNESLGIYDFIWINECFNSS